MAGNSFQCARVKPARVAQFIERDGSNIEDEGETPSASASVCSPLRFELQGGKPDFQGVMSVADGLAWNEEDGSAILSTLTSLRVSELRLGKPFRMVDRAVMSRS